MSKNQSIILDPANLPNLSEFQAKFLQRYLIHSNAERAWREAVGKGKSPPGRSQDLLQSPTIQAHLAYHQSQLQARFAVTSERVINHLAMIALSDIREIYDETGALLPVSEWPGSVAASVAGLETSESVANGSDYITQTNKVKRWDALKALKLLGEHLGLFDSGAGQREQAVTINLDMRRASIPYIDQDQEGRNLDGAAAYTEAAALLGAEQHTGKGQGRIKKNAMEQGNDAGLEPSSSLLVDK